MADPCIYLEIDYQQVAVSARFPRRIFRYRQRRARHARSSRSAIRATAIPTARSIRELPKSAGKLEERRRR